MVKKVVVKNSIKWHRFWALFALIGLFACGFMLGLFYGSSKELKMNLSSQDCENLAQEIIKITTNGATSENIDDLRNLNDLYSNSCAGRLVIINEESVKNADIDKECELYEAAIKSRIFPAEEPNFLAHYYNYVLYGRLSENGCSENSETYEKLAAAELELVNILKGSADIKTYEMNQIINDYEKTRLLEDKNEFLKNSL